MNPSRGLVSPVSFNSQILNEVVTTLVRVSVPNPRTAKGIQNSRRRSHKNVDSDVLIEQGHANSLICNTFRMIRGGIDGDIHAAVN